MGSAPALRSRPARGSPHPPDRRQATAGSRRHASGLTGRQMSTLTAHELSLHGHRVTYRTAGSGPALLLLHGVANSSQTWERVAPLLSPRFTLIAPDLLGHG